MGNRDERFHEYEELLDSFADKFDDDVIYHYTSSEALQGIVKDNELWLTNTAFVNDSTECKVLREKKDLFGVNELTNPYVKECWKQFIKDKDDDPNSYIASFCKNKNSLNQFRVYGHYRIGFKASDLKHKKFHLYDCVYESSDIREWILEKATSRFWEGKNLDKQAKRMAAFQLLDIASKKLKNHHFRDEDEVRMIVHSDHNWCYPQSPEMYDSQQPIHFRNSLKFNATIPYVKTIISKSDKKIDYEKLRTEPEIKAQKKRNETQLQREFLPIKNIMIGPMQNQESAKIALEILLEENGYKDFKVEKSEIPYRG